MAQFRDSILPYFTLDDDWKSIIFNAMNKKPEVSTHDEDRNRIKQALKNLRKQHLWGDITDEEYR